MLEATAIPTEPTTTAQEFFCLANEKVTYVYASTSHICELDFLHRSFSTLNLPVFSDITSIIFDDVIRISIGYVGNLFAHPSTPDFLGEVGLNLALGLVTSCCGRKTARWRPAYHWLWQGSMSIGDPSKSNYGGSSALRK